MWESEHEWLSRMRCAACGGQAAQKDKKFDQHIRKKLGCGRSDKTHEFPILGGQETLQIKGCPHEAMGHGDMNLYKRAANWAENGRLNYLFDPEEMPDKVASALDLFEVESERKRSYLLQQASKKSKREQGGT